MLSWEIIAHGRVQGVGFRHHALLCSKRCDIRGYAKNLYDGTVLIMASGRKEDLTVFCELLRAGNGYSRVENLEIAELKDTVFYNDFEVR